MGGPRPVIVQGDSRQLRQVLQLAGVSCIVASPPYSEIASGAGGLNTKPARAGQQGGRSPASASQATDQRYGDSDGQLAKLPAGTVDAVVASPPFTQGYAGGGGINVKGYGDGTDKVGDRTYQGTAGERTEGNLETMPLGDVTTLETASPTFWSAARDIVAESFAILKAGGIAVWVVKPFVRKKRIVDFPADWRVLCEHVGFVTEQEVHASLVCETTNNDLFDGLSTKRRERKSFFRRLAEAKGSPRIDFEVVYFMRRPE